MLIFCDFIHVDVFTTNHHLNLKLSNAFNTHVCMQLFFSLVLF